MRNILLARHGREQPLYRTAGSPMRRSRSVNRGSEYSLRNAGSSKSAAHASSCSDEHAFEQLERPLLVAQPRIQGGQLASQRSHRRDIGLRLPARLELCDPRLQVSLGTPLGDRIFERSEIRLTDAVRGMALQIRVERLLRRSLVIQRVGKLQKRTGIVRGEREIALVILDGAIELTRDQIVVGVMARGERGRAAVASAYRRGTRRSGT